MYMIKLVELEMHSFSKFSDFFFLSFSSLQLTVAGFFFSIETFTALTCYILLLYFMFCFVNRYLFFLPNYLKCSGLLNYCTVLAR